MKVGAGHRPTRLTWLSKMLLPPSTSTLTLPSDGLVTIERTVDKAFTATLAVLPFTTAEAVSFAVPLNGKRARYLGTGYKFLHEVAPGIGHIDLNAGRAFGQVNARVYRAALGELGG